MTRFDCGCMLELFIFSLVAHSTASRCVGAQFDGKYAASADNTTMLFIWDLPSRTLLHTVNSMHTAYVTALSCRLLLDCGSSNLACKVEHTPISFLKDLSFLPCLEVCPS
jgi:WD40 repeat protein